VTDLGLAAPRDAVPRVLRQLLNVAGAAIVGTLLVNTVLIERPLWVWILSGLGLLGWVLRELIPAGSPANLVAILVAIAASSAVAASTSVTGYIPGIICLSVLLATTPRSVAFRVAVGLGSALLAAADGILVGAGTGVLLGAGAGLVIASLVGVSRRQYRLSEERERELLDERLRLSEERAHGAALAERSRIARDIHDVLAHSLGGLVLQLDAVDALLESGSTDEAHARVLAARGLAADGLDEARRAVDALRDPEISADLAGAVDELVVTHRALGARAALRVAGEPGELSPDAAGALRRAAQEVLSNARRHAPGQQTALLLTWTPDAATLTATTPLTPGAPPSGSGGARGLLGLGERVEVLGGTADWAVHDGSFVVTARVPRVKEVRS
jgi:signal transduction histidine kinase